MSSQFSNSLAISNVLSAHLKNSSQLNGHLGGHQLTSPPPPPLLKSNLLNLSQQLLQRANCLTSKQWEQLTYDIDALSSSSSFSNCSPSSYLAQNGNYLNQLLAQQQRKSSLTSTLKLIDYNQQLNQLHSHLNNYQRQLSQQQQQQQNASQFESNKHLSVDEQDLVLDLSKSNKTTVTNGSKFKDLPSIKLSSSLSTPVPSGALADEIKLLKRPSSLPQQKLSAAISSTTTTKQPVGGLGKKRSSNSSSSKKLSRKMPFDEHKSSPVSGTFILSDEDAALTEFCKNGDIDPNFNRVSITPEAKAELSKIQNQIGDYVCRLCKLCFEDAFGLAQHRCSRIVHIEYKCPECNKEFNCPANLASHRRWHKPNAKQSAAGSSSPVNGQSANGQSANGQSANSSTANRTKADVNRKEEGNRNKHLAVLNGSNSSAKSSGNSRSNTPSDKCTPPAIETASSTVCSLGQQKISIKLQNQIVSVSVSKDDQPRPANNRVRVTKTAILPEEKDIERLENAAAELLAGQPSKEKAADKKVRDDGKAAKAISGAEELVERITQPTEEAVSRTGQQATGGDQQVVASDSYCPKKFRRQQYLSKSPRSENQENEIMNFNITACDDDSSQADCGSLNSSINSTVANLINSATASVVSSLLQQHSNTPRKKRARSSVTTDESSGLMRLDDCSIDEQVFSDPANSDDSSTSFESQKKFLILKKLKSEQTS